MVPVRPANKRPTIAGDILWEGLLAFYQASKAVGVEIVDVKLGPDVWGETAVTS